MIENQPNELTLIYHSDKGDDKKARAFIESVTEYKVKTLDLKRDSITETQLAEIADKMGVKIEMLFDHTYQDRFQAQKPLNANAVTDSDLVAILAHEQVLIKTPIVIIGKKAYQYDSANEILTKIIITGFKGENTIVFKE